jgi:hypothetical protein
VYIPRNNESGLRERSELTRGVTPEVADVMAEREWGRAGAIAERAVG